MWINCNGVFFPENALPVADADVGLRYGVSVFETLRWTGTEVPLLEGHYSRLKDGLAMLETPLPAFFTLDFLLSALKDTVNQNKIAGAARLRLQVTPAGIAGKERCFSGIGYRVACNPCEALIFSPLGLRIGFSKKDYRALPPPFCAFKTGSYAPYFLASLEAKKRGLDDILLLNTGGRIGESATANVFWTESNRLFTPPVSEGIVAGVARSHLLQVLSHRGFTVEEQPLTKDRLQQADSLFLTNAFRGLRWVASCDGKDFKKGFAESLFQEAFSILS